MSACPTPEKHRHRSRIGAVKARDALERDKGIDLALEPYRCPCGAWHLGHKRKKTRAPGWARRAGLDRLTTPANDSTDDEGDEG